MFLNPIKLKCKFGMHYDMVNIMQMFLSLTECQKISVFPEAKEMARSAEERGEKKSLK